jgi:hypothetical protein
MVGLGLADGATGAILAPLIAGLISLLGLIISKEHKISDYRQAWIDALRADIAALIAHAHAIEGAHLAMYNTDEKWKIVREDFVGINEAWARIKLRLNPKEEASIVVFIILKEHESIFNSVASGSVPDFGRLPSLYDRLVDDTQVILKKRMGPCS